MGVELLNCLIKNYSLISYNVDPSYNLLKKSGFFISTYGNHNLTANIDSDIAVATILKDDQYLKALTKTHGDDLMFLFFYMSDEMELLCKKIKIPIALPSYGIQKKLGNKLHIRNICEKLGIETNTSMNINLSKENNLARIYKRCEKKLGIPFIIQGEQGVSGENTIKIINYREFVKTVKKLGGKYRATRYLNQIIPVSVHICITKRRILYEGPYPQIVGFKELTSNPFQFSGNDTNQKMFTEKVKSNINYMSLKLANYAKKSGYRGILGIDFIWNRYTDRIYVQEINSRLVGLTRLITGIQKEQGITPHLIEHLNEFVPIANLFRRINKPVNLSKSNYSQIYISNNSNHNIRTKNYLRPGIYRISKKTLIRTKNSLFLSDMNKNEVLINFFAYKGTLLEPGQIISKIILKKSVLNRNKYELSKVSKDLISLIKSYATNSL